MFASIRRYRMREGPMEELARRVDEGFAEEVMAQPGFVSYEFVDSGDGEVITLSVFREPEEAEASRALAQRWTDESLEDFEFSRIEALRGEVLVSRAAQDMLEPGHAGAGEKFASLRRYRLRSGSVAELMHVVDDVFADRIQRMDGFEAYHALDCGRGEIVSISLFRDQTTAEESDERALEFIREDLSDFDMERTEVIGGRVTVSRALADLLEPAHA
jgi:Antibiotic biosynthesis monooxygenase